MTDMYTRPSRDQIAAEVQARANLPGASRDDAAAREPETKTQDYLKNFGTHLTARMRALGWTQADLQEHAKISAHLAARAINGNGVELGLAAQLARAVGSMLPAMLGEYTCGTCEGMPPPGYGCLECGTEGERQ
jgi:hypothetical protein